MGYLRTPEHRAQSAARCRLHRPWEKSTGPRTDEGKARAARNPFKGAYREQLRELARELNAALRAQREAIDAS